MCSPRWNGEAKRAPMCMLHWSIWVQISSLSCLWKEWGLKRELWFLMLKKSIKMVVTIDRCGIFVFTWKRPRGLCQCLLLTNQSSKPFRQPHQESFLAHVGPFCETLPSLPHHPGLTFTTSLSSNPHPYSLPLIEGQPALLVIDGFIHLNEGRLEEWFSGWLQESLK